MHNSIQINKQCGAQEEEEFNLDVVVEALLWRACYTVAGSAEHFMAQLAANQDDWTAFNNR
jgi:hypothetical protein